MAGLDSNDEIHRLDQLIDKGTDETLESTRRILQTAKETNQIGVDTLVKLNEQEDLLRKPQIPEWLFVIAEIQQGEKIDNVEQRMDEMKVGLKVADKNIRELESICGCCYCPCGKPRSVQGTKWYKKTDGKKTKHHVVNQQPRSGGGKRGAPKGKYIKTITGDEREVEIENNLTEVEVIVDNLQGLASDLGNEFDRQNEKLHDVNRKTEDNIIHLQSANERLDRV